MADKVHYQSDLFLNLSVIVAIVLDQYVGLRGADPVFGIIITMDVVTGLLALFVLKPMRKRYALG